MLKIQKGVLCLPVTTKAGAALADLVVQTAFHYGAKSEEDENKLRALGSMLRGQIPLMDIEIDINGIGHGLDEYDIEITYIDGQFQAKAAEFPSVITTGDTPKEAKENLESTLDLITSSMRSRGEEVPEPKRSGNE